MATLFPIDKNIPLPEKPELTIDRIHDTMLALQVGESFRCPAIYARSMVRAARLGGCSMTFEGRDIVGTTDGRIWRTA